MDLASFINSEETRKHIKNVVYPIGDLIYSEMSFYVWLFIIYNIFLFFIVLANLLLLIRLLRMSNTTSISIESHQ
jgi:hypothetical protein